ncbi:hypothetical protein HN51_027355 [Arachis hypogaea]|uniref:HMA domain-containing protein n=2 Tax=Arachis TaxID=3817 RepID=A0A445BNF6_ARAHY|nr:heavy metal-associated isoprenylated plant protein 4 [Arachis duranensis]XP_025618215.1 heavy metal-associated isoprenylated plant protein 4 [Arachis hypogaea]QHO33688.1 uncharacterized protein DS421_9g260420 [Arachis hypogaea]RYR40207.1 hypothetical protein Ahy_A09g045916 isoform B [Arachis hypogaea]
MGAGKEEKEEIIEVITAIYKVNLHCPKCGSNIKKHLLTIEGVHSVEIDTEKGEIKAKGKLDPLKILKIIEKKSKRKVELISPKIKPKENIPTDSKPKEKKEPIVRTITVKTHMHCDKCEADLRTMLLKHKGIFNVKIDKKVHTVTVEGTIEEEKLISFMKKKVHKNAEVISIKELKMVEKKEVKEEGEKSGESTKKKDGETTKEKDETKTKENVPYFIHYVYGPQLFSDENPNSCSIL